VQLEHRRDDAFGRLLGVNYTREVLQVLLGFADCRRIVGRADAFVAGDDDPRLQAGDLIEAGDPVLAPFSASTLDLLEVRQLDRSANHQDQVTAVHPDDR
jgi:hypothetical protein